MGYYTLYEVTISNLDSEEQGHRVAGVLGASLYDLSSDGAVMHYEDYKKWYCWKEDCVRASLQNPKILIEVEGKGEESGDIWKARIQDGICECVPAKIVFDDFKLIVK
jgi:hypothetical protein